MLVAEHLACAGDTRLHLIGNEQHVVLLAEVVALLQIAIIRNKHTSLALDGFCNETADFVAILLESLFKSLGIVVGNADESGSQRTVVGVRTGVVAHGDDGHGASVEVAFAADNLDLVVGNTLLHGTPAAGKLQGCFHTLSTCVHG